MLTLRLLCLLALVPSIGCSRPTAPGDDDSTGDDDDSPPVPFRFWATAFEWGGDLPVEYECFSGNPEIRWEGVPEGTDSLGLIFDDPTAGDFPHWAIYRMDPASTGIAEGASRRAEDLPDGSRELTNGFGTEGYLGSCPNGHNHYRWRLWAVDDSFEAPSTSASYDELEDALEDAEIEMLEGDHWYGPAQNR
jgi:Raf kinase inhibitor-like YbhB/YbcL family protein